MSEIPAAVLDELAGDTATIDDAADTMTITCSICDETITGKRAGAGSALWKRGTHRFTKHGIRKGERPVRPKGGEPTADELAGDGAWPMLAAVRDIAAGVGSKGSRAPNADELSRGMGRGLGLATVAAASFLVETDQGIPEGPAGDAERERLIDWLSLTDKAAQDIMRPFGRAIAPTRLNTKYGRGLVENVDTIGSVAELASLAMHWRQYLRSRGGPPAAPMPGPAPVLMPMHPGDGGVAFAAAAQPAMTSPDLATPAPQKGVVLGPADIERIQRQRREAGGR